MQIAFRQLLNTDVPTKEWTVLYREAYTLVLYRRGDDLYDALKTSLLEHVRTRVVPSLTQSEDANLFGVLRRQRYNFYCAYSQIRGILMYMDRTYVQQAGVLPVKELAAQVFQQEISLHANLGVRLRPILIAPFLRGIDGEDVDWKSWNEWRKILLVSSDDSRLLYEEQFEVPLLAEVTEHYRFKLRKLVADKTAGGFDLLMNAFMESETLYLENVDDKTTKEWLRSALDNVVTDSKHTNA